MNGKEYLMVQMTLIELGKRTSALDLTNFLKAITNAETAAPMLDPTAYIKAQANLKAIKELAQAFQNVQIRFEKVRDSAIRTTVGFIQRGEPLPKTNEAQLAEFTEKEK